MIKTAVWGVLVLALMSACQDEKNDPANRKAALGAGTGLAPAATAPRPSMKPVEERNLWTYSKDDGSVPPWQPGAVIVKFAEPWASRVDGVLAAELGLDLDLRSKVGVHLMRLRRAETVPEAVERLRTDPRVEYAEPNHRIRFLNVPNDPRFDECWGLDNTGQTGGTADADIDAVEAWDISIGSWDVVVAVLDTGVDYTHPDLDINMWTNEDEIANNGVDDDGNGYIDDVIGWDFEHENNDPMDDYSHGTHCAGTIGAVGHNNLGVAGVSWRVTIMPLRIIGDQELDAYCLDAAEAIHYAVDNGAHVMSCSWWTIEHYNQTLEEAVQYSEQQGVILVAAAGNDSRDDDDPGYSHWPSEWPYDNIIAVAATNHDDGRASFSNWGPISVDVGAPGEDVLSTIWPGHGYDTMSGTSMAAPHVAGTVALMLSIRPELTVAEVKQFLFNTIDPIPDLQGLTVTGGRINAFTALQAISGIPLPPVALAGGNQTVMTGTTVTLDGSASFDPNQDPITYFWEFYPPGHSGATLDDDTIDTPKFFADVCGEYQAFLAVTDDGGLESDPDRARVQVMNWTDQDPVIETTHPYADNMDETWTITIPGSVVMGVHFASFDTERGWDFVRILDGDDVEWAIYDGALGEFNSVVVEGNTIKIRFTSDGSVTRDGFAIDGAWWCDAGNCPPGQGDCNDNPADGCETDTFSDIDNCGWCGHACSFANASAQCNSGMCEIIACDAGFEDCDGEVGNGCEADLAYDPLNCGACGDACSDVYPNAGVECLVGACYMGPCDPGWADCDWEEMNGCETSVVADPDNCGGCDIQCVLPNATHTFCEDAVCYVGDCTVSPQNIETDHPYSNDQDLSWQIVHPGAIEVTVHFAMFSTERNYDYVELRDGGDNEIVQYWGDLGAFTSDPVPGPIVNIVFQSDGWYVMDGFAIDSSRSCIGTGCAAGWGECDGDPINGCETDVLTDLDHCGACGQMCGAPHTDGDCTGGVCTAGVDCLAGWGDCDGDPVNGCEIDLNNDPDHCSTCGNACSDVYPNADVTCAGGTCEMGECEPGWADCNLDPADGCETSLIADPDNCGACGEQCVLPHVDHPYCEDGTCQIGECLVFPENIETDHPYDNYADQQWLIQHPGANAVEVHFAMFDTESYYDYVQLRDAGNNLIVQYSGNLGPFTAEPVPGDTVLVMFHSDGWFTEEGFAIDWSRACSGTGCEAGWDDCDDDPSSGCESDVSADPDNCGACGASCVFNHGSGSCVDSTCAIDSCDVDWSDCNADGWDGCEADLDSDVDHCGSCVNACSDLYPNADVTCVGGTCEMGACHAGFVDCNSDPADGCEVDTNADPVNCGGCFQVCDLPNATAGCAGGSCTVAGCDVGWGDCDGIPASGCEQGVLDDDSNCGGCRITCDLPHASAHCAGLVCVIDACDGGWDDCDGNERNGCEADLQSDPDNCGSCGYDCTIPGTATICDQGECAVGDCEINFNDCNRDPDDGCESYRLSDPENCGECGFSCAADHADSNCINGMCFMGDCHEGFANCNHNNADGCEVNVGEDAGNCGACDRVCELQYATAACIGGDCVVADCAQDRGDCDGEGFNGCEVDLTVDPNHCGGCGQACDLAHATSECTAGGCSIDRCDNGFADCNDGDDDGCEVDKLTDPANCGHCGVACPDGQACEMGVCVCRDEDGDGHEDVGCGGDDCDDADAEVNPSADEVCEDAVDNDCDGETDEDCEEEEPEVEGGGCGCGVGAGSASAWLWLGLVGLLAVRRRRA